MSPASPHSGNATADLELYNVRMRASANGRHISGAERIVAAPEIPQVTAQLTARALAHPKGTPTDIRVSAVRLESAPLTLSALPVTEHQARGREHLTRRLGELGVAATEAVLEALYTTATLRGAQLIDAATGAARHPDAARGVRVSTLDHRPPPTGEAKDHFREALTLATKVAHHPAVLAELCISDDPDYATGYLATAAGYERLHGVKDPGSELGARVFVLRPHLGAEELAELVDYLERTPVIVEVP